ncbi:hypothetical protein H2200_003463 [Cladophialophora chaetospira]|uniref:Uncharacterized protein n=1 Tax=Cladophialophora chaetospira TaxID=386627 RepID=A0AA39CMQ8_9EURO|nr:hypothetical protein H2200_003463 [Cladophialophora chaetospira]
MNWSKVEELALLGYWRNDMASFLNSTTSVLTGLRRLELEGGCSGAMLQLVQNLRNNSLTHVTWRGCHNPDLPSIVQESQGSFLQHLDVHIVETTHVESPAFSASELEPLRHMSNLTYLALNVARNGTWPFETLSGISRIPSLRTADVWVDIASTCRKQKENNYWSEQDSACVGEDQFLLPFINETSTLEVFKYLRANKVGHELTNVTFWGGDWSRAWDGPIYSPPWIEHRRTKVVCSVKDEIALGEATCTVIEGANYWKSIGRRYWEYVDDDDAVNEYIV